MREGQFIKKNLSRWEESKEPSTNPDVLAKQFTSLLDDLAYAKTFYPYSNTVKYINSIAAKIFLSIYQNKKEKISRVYSFAAIDVPLAIYRSRKAFLVSLLAFLAFIDTVLGRGYVAMTEYNIAEGRPFGVYDDDHALSMYFQIMFNNLFVSARMYCMGITLGIGTLYSLMNNGIMLGAFDYLFAKHGLQGKFFLVVFIHGTLELSAIVVSAAAGLTVAGAILFPKTYKRIEAFREAGKDSIKIFLAQVPMLLVAAFFESYITRYANMPLFFSLLILGGSGTFVVWYFILYPIKVHKKYGSSLP